MKGIFVTGTDTNTGKTVITGLLAKYILERGRSVITQKWVETGSVSGYSFDVERHLQIMKKDKPSMEKYSSYIAPYVFSAPCSPHLASRMENKKINVNKIKRSFKLLSAEFDFVIVEGTGGLLVPFDGKNLIADIVKNLKLAVLVVAKNKLGAINHTLLTLEALNRRNIDVLGVLFNNSFDSPERVIKDNPRIIKKFTKEEIFGVLPWANAHNELYKSFSAIGDKIWKKIAA